MCGVVCLVCGVSRVWCVWCVVCLVCGVSRVRCVSCEVCLVCGVSRVWCDSCVVCPVLPSSRPASDPIIRVLNGSSSRSVPPHPPATKKIRESSPRAPCIRMQPCAGRADRDTPHPPAVVLKSSLPQTQCCRLAVLNRNPCNFENDLVTSGQRHYKPFNSHVYKSSHARGSIINICTSPWITTPGARAMLRATIVWNWIYSHTS